MNSQNPSTDLQKTVPADYVPPVSLHRFCHITGLSLGWRTGRRILRCEANSRFHRPFSPVGCEFVHEGREIESGCFTYERAVEDTLGLQRGIAPSLFPNQALHRPLLVA